MKIGISFFTVEGVTYFLVKIGSKSFSSFGTPEILTELLYLNE